MPQTATLAPNIDEVVQGARLLNFLPYLEDEIQKMRDIVEAKVAKHIAQGTLTPELAYNFWLERHSYTTLLGRFATKARMAAAQGDKNRAVLEASS